MCINVYERSSERWLFPASVGRTPIIKPFINSFIHYLLHTGSRLHQFSKVLDPIDSHQFRSLPSCPHHIWAKSRPINASSQFVQRILDNKVSILGNIVSILLVSILDNVVGILNS